MSRLHSKAYLGAALVFTLIAGAAQAQPSSFEERRQLMRQMSQQLQARLTQQMSHQLQARLEQRLRCINQAKTFADLDQCQRANGIGWHHGAGMGGWGCPMW
jgi:Flp pilus assembly protein TadB